MDETPFSEKTCKIDAETSRFYTKILTGERGLLRRTTGNNWHRDWVFNQFKKTVVGVVLAVVTTRFAIAVVVRPRPSPSRFWVWIRAVSGADDDGGIQSGSAAALVLDRRLVVLLMTERLDREHRHVDGDAREANPLLTSAVPG